MRKLILASHGSLAEGMLSAVKMIVGENIEIDTYGLDTYKNPIDIYEHLEKEIRKDLETTYVILCDINGGSVYNQLMHLCKYQNVYIMTGMILSIVLELQLASEDEPIEELLKKVSTNAKDNILIFNYKWVQKEIGKGIEDDKLW